MEKKFFAGVVVASNNDNQYIREYVEHYLSIGFDKVIIYDNNDIDGPCPLDALKGLEKHIIYTNIRGDKSKTRQPATYSDAYNKYNYYFEWLCFFDNDEYLFLNQDKSIKDYLSRDMFKDIDVIHVNWKIYGDNGRIHPDPNLSTFEQFPEPVNLNTRTAYSCPQNDHIKTIVHCTGKEIYFNHPHFCRSRNSEVIAVNESGIRIRNDWPWTPYSYNFAELRHYQLRSTEEFCFKRLGGRGLQRFDGSPVKIKDEIQWYFSYNEYTEEKMAFIVEWLTSHQK